MLYTLFGAMLAIAIATVVLPLYRRERGISARALAGGMVIVFVSVLTYQQLGSPDVDSARPGDVPGIDEMVNSLAARLEQQPGDLDGWKMLGRSYVQLRDFSAAVTAFERAVELENGGNAQTLADLGEALLMVDGSALNGRARTLFDNALALSPSNQKALFYAGMAAVERGERTLGADYWERLLASGPPENIRDILRQQIAELRGEAPPPPAPAPEARADVVVASVVLGDGAAADVQPDHTVFVIARDPAQPSPPIAVQRRKASELPAVVRIGDADAMIPGRVPSAFAELEIVARVSRSGEPGARTGDWFGQGKVSTAASGEVTISIDQQVP